MSYVLWIEGRAYYSRRVPEIVREFDSRRYVKIALRTDSKSEAKRKAVIINQEVEDYWKDLIQNRQQHENNRFQKTMRVAQQMGFAYKPMSQIIQLPIFDLLERVLALKEATPKQTEALLGAKDEPEVTLKQALDMYWGLAKDKVIGKSDFQIRKWQNPRRKAVENFIAIRSNKNLKDITRDDIIAFRDWWIDRIKEEKRDADSANKNLLHLRAVLKAVSGHLKLGLDIRHLFEDVLLKVRRKKTRLPFTPEQIITILASPKLENMHPEAKWFLHIMAETGARPSEIVGLTKENIRLDDAIPHIDIKEADGGSLKTEYSPRKIPLVGYALDAFQHLPEGFTHYRNKSDILTTAINKFLRANDLVPKKGYTCYSLRHSFQDRLVKAKAIDRVQTDLMGHRFDKDREDYGLGSDIETKLEYMEMVCLKSKAALIAFNQDG